MKARLRQKILDYLQKREIVIFGAGIMAHEFYERYKNKLNFAFCVTNDSREWGKKRFCGELDVRQYSVQALKGKYYIVLCAYLAFDSIASQMECDGYDMFHDFVDYKAAEAVLDGKKLAFFYGTCILRDAYHLLERVPAFVEQYVSVFMQASPEEKETMAEFRRFYYGKALCDTYVYARKLIHDNMQKKDLPSDCSMIGVSNVIFSGYWPQLHNMRYNENWLFDVMAPFDNNFWHLMYTREDANITTLVKEGKTPEEIYKILSADDYYSEKDMNKHLRICFKTIEMAEQGVDVKVGDFIRSQYKKKQIYQDYTHPKKSVLWEYAKQILEHLDVYDEHLENIMEESPEYIHRSSDMPIYPSVAKILDLPWVDANIRYEVITCKGIQLMTFKEYVLHYAEYTQAALKLREGW